MHIVISIWRVNPPTGEILARPDIGPRAAGEVRRIDGAPFVGWIELISALEQVLRAARE